MTDLDRFLRHVYGANRFYLILATLNRPKGQRWEEKYVPYRPGESATIAGMIERAGAGGRDAYLCAHGYRDDTRPAQKQNASDIECLWVERDAATIPPDAPPPTLTIETSPGRFHDYWRLSRPVPPEVAEGLNRRLTLLIGGDAGWALTKKLRPPGSRNFKHADGPVSRIVAIDDDRALDPDELDRVLPPLPASPASSKSAGAAEASTGADEPPVALSERGQRVWRGELRVMRQDGSGQIDRSRTLYELACEGWEANATQRAVVAMLRDRDAAWDWNYEVEKPGDFQRIAGKVATLPRKVVPIPEPRLSLDPPTTGEAASGSPCEANVARLKREIARLIGELDQRDAEIKDLREQNTTIINVVTNPHLKAAAPTVIRTAVHYARAKARGEVDEDGFVNVNPSVIGDDFPDGGTPIRARATVKRHLDRLADDGLIRHKVQPAFVQRFVRDGDGKPIRDETGKPRTERVKVAQTWVNFTGDSLTEVLKPFAFFRPPEPEPDAEPSHGRHGGDRRSAAFRAAIASPPPCPHCGEDALIVACRACGSRVAPADFAEADELAFQDETDSEGAPFPTIDSTAFQDELSKNGSQRTLWTTPPSFQAEPRSCEKQDRAEALLTWDRGRSPTPIDKWTS